MQGAFSMLSNNLKTICFSVMAGQKREARLRTRRPGHPRLSCSIGPKTWMPGIADKFTQSAQGRLLWPGMTSFATETDFIGCFLSQALRSRRPGKGGSVLHGRLKLWVARSRGSPGPVDHSRCDHADTVAFNVVFQADLHEDQRGYSDHCNDCSRRHRYEVAPVFAMGVHFSQSPCFGLVSNSGLTMFQDTWRQ